MKTNDNLNNTMNKEFKQFTPSANLIVPLNPILVNENSQLKLQYTLLYEEYQKLIQKIELF